MSCVTVLDDGHHYRTGITAVARGAGVALALLALSCSRGFREPITTVAPRLSAPLPYKDVLGFLRFVPGGPDDPTVLVTAAKRQLPFGSEVLDPVATLLGLVNEEGCVPSHGPVVVLFLDPAVHGASFAFAWRGSAEELRVAARGARLRMPDPDRLELEGRGRAQGMQVLLDAVRQRGVQGIGRETWQVQREDDAQAPVEPRLTLYVVEEAGCVLLLPARDGLRNVAGTLAATGALDPATGNASCLSLAAGVLVERASGDLRNVVFFAVDRMLDALKLDPHTMEARHQYFEDRRSIIAMVDSTFDACSAIDGLFALRTEHGVDVSLRAAPKSLLGDLLTVPVDLPTAELLHDAPEEGIVLAFSLDPKALAQVPTMARRATKGFRALRHGPEHRRSTATASDEPAFLDSFAGRAWIALENDEPESGPRVVVRAQMRDDAVDKGLGWAVIDAALPNAASGALRRTSMAYSWTARLEDGTLEVFGKDSRERGPDEMKRIVSGPSARPFPGCPEHAFLVLQSTFGKRSVGVACERSPSGLHLTLLAPEE